MKIKYSIYYLIALLSSLSVETQHIQPSTKDILDKLEQFQRQNEQEEATEVLDAGINATTSPAEMAYLYAYKSSIYSSTNT
mgnify:CR=1 FL=1